MKLRVRTVVELTVPVLIAAVLVWWSVGDAATPGEQIAPSLEVEPMPALKSQGRPIVDIQTSHQWLQLSARTWILALP